MTTQAWSFMILAWLLIISQTGYCFWKLLSSERQLDDDEEEASSAES